MNLDNKSFLNCTRIVGGFNCNFKFKILSYNNPWMSQKYSAAQLQSMLQQLIERATDNSLKGIDTNMNQKVCQVLLQYKDL